MENETVNTIGSESVASTPKDNGKAGPKIGELSSFQSSPDSSGDAAGRGQASGGKKGKGKGKIGRPPKNDAGFSKAQIDEVASDPEIEAARVEFEECIVELLVATTDGLAENKFNTLRNRYPEAEARGLADKFRLTEKERKYFGALAIRLWRKYLGDKYLFTDEAIAAVYLLQYGMRNLEGFTQSRKIESALNAKTADKQPGLQRTPSPDTRSERNGKIDNHKPDDLHAPGRASADL